MDVASIREDAALLRDQTVLVAEGRIVAIGPRDLGASASTGRSCSLAMPVDRARYVETAERLAQAGVWTVPTLVERHHAVSDAVTLERWLAEPQMRWIPADGVELWTRQVGDATARMDAADWQLVERGAAQRARLVAALLAAGAPLLAGTGTPNAFLVPGHALIEEIEAMVAAGLPEEAALATSMREAARFLGRLDEPGTIELGKRADLLLVEGDPFSGIAALHRRAGVMSGGRWFDVDGLDALGHRESSASGCESGPDV